MRRRASRFAAPVLGAALWLVWAAQHEYTGIRAPWTGMTLAACGTSFVVAGYLGRGWPAFAGAAGAAALAIVLVDLLIWRVDRVASDTPASCDPGCIPTEFAVVMAALVAVALAAVGVALRLVSDRARCRGSAA